MSDLYRCMNSAFCAGMMPGRLSRKIPLCQTSHGSLVAQLVYSLVSRCTGVNTWSGLPRARGFVYFCCTTRYRCYDLVLDCFKGSSVKYSICTLLYHHELALPVSRV